MKALNISDSYPLRGTPIIVSEDFDEPLSSLWEACDVAETSKEFQKKTDGDRKSCKDESSLKRQWRALAGCQS